MPAAHTRVFVSHSTKNAKFTDALVERLRDHYVATWYAPRHMPSGYFLGNIRDALANCDWFLLVLSPRSGSSMYFGRSRRRSSRCCNRSGTPTRSGGWK